MQASPSCSSRTFGVFCASSAGAHWALVPWCGICITVRRCLGSCRRSSVILCGCRFRIVEVVQQEQETSHASNYRVCTFVCSNTLATLRGDLEVMSTNSTKHQKSELTCRALGKAYGANPIPDTCVLNHLSFLVRSRRRAAIALVANREHGRGVPHVSLQQKRNREKGERLPNQNVIIE